MRAVRALVLTLSLLPGCTPFIPVKSDFASSALAPAGSIPPEFAEFNSYDPSVNAMLADQICTTPYQPLYVKNISAATGRIVQADGRCQTHIPLFGP